MAYSFWSPITQIGSIGCVSSMAVLLQPFPKLITGTMQINALQMYGPLEMGLSLCSHLLMNRKLILNKNSLGILLELYNLDFILIML